MQSLNTIQQLMCVSWKGASFKYIRLNISLYVSIWYARIKAYLLQKFQKHPSRKYLNVQILFFRIESLLKKKF